MCHTARGMAECQTSSVAALYVILSDTSDSEYRSGDDNVSEDQDCGVVASADQDCNEVNNEDRNSSTSAVSLLSILKAPRLSDLSRKRKVVVNPSPKGKRSSTGRTSKTTVNIKPDQHVKEYPGEHFTVSNGKLFCEACREMLNIKKSSINNHVQLAKHKDRVVRL